MLSANPLPFFILWMHDTNIPFAKGNCRQPFFIKIKNFMKVCRWYSSKIADTEIELRSLTSHCGIA